MRENDLRVRCLELAIDFIKNSSDCKTKDPIELAKSFMDYVKPTSENTAA